MCPFFGYILMDSGIFYSLLFFSLLDFIFFKEVTETDETPMALRIAYLINESSSIPFVFSELFMSCFPFYLLSR